MLALGLEVIYLSVLCDDCDKEKIVIVFVTVN
jgi:hypothetical protein